jgi:hypothetical protein
LEENKDLLLLLLLLKAQVEVYNKIVGFACVWKAG